MSVGKRRMTLARVRGRMRLLASSIIALRRVEQKKGKPISYGQFTDPGPNTNINRFPDVFTGGN